MACGYKTFWNLSIFVRSWPRVLILKENCLIINFYLVLSILSTCWTKFIVAIDLCHCLLMPWTAFRPLFNFLHHFCTTLLLIKLYHLHTSVKRKQIAVHNLFFGGEWILKTMFNRLYLGYKNELKPISTEVILRGAQLQDVHIFHKYF